MRHLYSVPGEYSSNHATQEDSDVAVPDNEEHWQNPFTVLGLTQEASDAEIRRAYLRLSRLHPDKLLSANRTLQIPHVGDAASDPFHRISEAYAVLQRPYSRHAIAKYGQKGQKALQNLKINTAVRSHESIERALLQEIAKLQQKEENADGDEWTQHTHVTASMLLDTPEVSSRPPKSIADVLELDNEVIMNSTTSASRHKHHFATYHCARQNEYEQIKPREMVRRIWQWYRTLKARLRLRSSKLSHAMSWQCNERLAVGCVVDMSIATGQWTSAFILPTIDIAWRPGLMTSAALEVGNEPAVSVGGTCSVGGMNQIKVQARLSADRKLISTIHVDRLFRPGQSTNSSALKGGVSAMLSDNTLANVRLHGSCNGPYGWPLRGNISCTAHQCTARATVHTKRGHDHQKGSLKFSSSVAYSVPHAELVFLAPKQMSQVQSSMSAHMQRISVDSSLSVVLSLSSTLSISTAVSRHRIQIEVSLRAAGWLFNVPIVLASGSQVSSGKQIAALAIPSSLAAFLTIARTVIGQITRHRRLNAKYVKLLADCNPIGAVLLAQRRSSEQFRQSLQHDAHRVMREEQIRKGLVIHDALYSWEAGNSSDNTDELFPAWVDATVSLQSQVKDGLVKWDQPIHTLPGLYSPNNQEPSLFPPGTLYVTYSLNDQHYKCVIDDCNPLLLPLPDMPPLSPDKVSEELDRIQVQRALRERSIVKLV